jgi:hypothetical protein
MYGRRPGDQDPAGLIGPRSSSGVDPRREERMAPRSVDADLPVGWIAGVAQVVEERPGHAVAVGVRADDQPAARRHERREQAGDEVRQPAGRNLVVERRDVREAVQVMTEPVQIRLASSGCRDRASSASAGNSSRPYGSILTPRSAHQAGNVASRCPLAQPTSSQVPSPSIGTHRCLALRAPRAFRGFARPRPPGPAPAAR